jgi:amino acid adenylation domain-containing protein
MSPSAQVAALSEVQMASWREYLRDAPPSAFPRRTDRAVSPTPSALLRRKIVLPRKRVPGVSPETVIQAAWALVNVFYSDSDDVVYGLAVVEEASDETEELPSLSALPARFTLEPTQSVKACLEATEARTLPLISLMASREACLPAIAALGPDARTATKFDNQLVIFSDMMGTQDVVLDRAVNVECTLSRQGVMARAFYDPAVVDPVQMQRVLGTFEALVRQLGNVVNQGKALEDLDLISDEDLVQVKQWNKAVAPAVERTMVDLVADKVREAPSAEAICSLELTSTYAELDNLTDKLAHALVARGVRPGHIVPFMFEKSPWAVVSMLATLKAGAAFCPLDPAHQWTDTAGILASTRANLVVCSPSHEGRFRDNRVSALVVDAASVRSLPARGPATSSVQPSDPGYVIFTSGSTGKPKGIVCSHSAWCSNALAHGVSELSGPTTRALQYSAYTFDISISDIFTTLAFGGCVCVPTESERLNDLSGCVARMGVTQVVATPTVAQFLKPDEVPSVKVLVCGGESMSQEFLAVWAHRVTLINSYGPAEATSRITSCVKAAGDDGSVIGTAHGGCVWVTASNNPAKLVPIGSVGELIIEGPVLADGYLDNEAKTREAFIEKPEWLRRAFPDRAAGKVYRTGDLVQYTADGSLQFLGRRDTQIKLHGVRLECGHIESKILTALPAESSVVVEKIYAGSKQLLAAFLTVPRFSSGGAAAVLENTSEIRDFVAALQRTLLAELPSYMVPNVFLPLTAIPLGATGKINRRALQAIAKDIPEAELNQFAATRASGDVAEGDKPSTNAEKTLAGVWASVLGLSLDAISKEDSFFGLGGDSVLAMKVVSAASESGIAVSVADIFQSPKLADLASRIGTSTVVELEPLGPFTLIGGVAKFQEVREQLSKSYKITARRVEDIYPATSLQAAMMGETIASPEAYILQEVLELAVDVDIEKLQSAWEDAAAAYPILRTRIGTFKGLGTCQIVMTENEPVAWTEADNLAIYLADDKKNHMCYGDVLSRFAVVDGKFLVWTCHHAITDGQMHRDVLSRVEAAYNGQPLKSSTAFNHFVAHLAQTDAAASADFWRAQFAGSGAVAFPAMEEDYEPAVTRYVSHSVPLPRDNTGFTSSILVRAAWALVLAQASGNSEVTIGITQSGRDVSLQGVEACLGPCLTTIPVRIATDVAKSVGEYLAAVQAQYIAMIPHQHAGVPAIRKTCPEAAAACAFNNLLVVQPAPGKPSSLLRPTKERNAGDALNFALLLECELGSGSMVVRAGFDEKVMGAQEVALLVHRLETVLAQVGSKASQALPLAKIDTVSKKDLELLDTFNPEVPALERCMHEMVEEQARLRPNAIAVDAWDAQLTFAQLFDYSDKLAGKLVQLGVGPEVVVPFAFEKSAWGVVAIHAILRAGGKYSLEVSIALG